VDSVCKRLILLILLGAALLGPLTARAASYQQAMEDYSDQNYSRSYKKAMSLAREKRGTRRGKALILAAAAVLELDRERKAKVLFRKALDEDPDLELPEVVRSRRAQRFFADVRDGRDGRGARTALTRSERTTTAFDRLETYLPFGLNQLVQGKILLGLSFGGAQAFGAYFAYTKNQEANQTEQEIATVRQRAIQTGDDINPVFLNLVAESKAFAKRSRQISQISLALAAASYGASVLEAGFRAPQHSAFAVQDPSSYQLFTMDHHQTRLHVELLNPLLAIQGLKVTVHF
jgi:hypothetical protein